MQPVPSNDYKAILDPFDKNVDQARYGQKDENNKEERKQFPVIVIKHVGDNLVYQDIEFTSDWGAANNPKEIAEFAKQRFTLINKRAKDIDEKLNRLQQLKAFVHTWSSYCDTHPTGIQGIWEWIKSIFGQGKRVGLEDAQTVESNIEREIQTLQVLKQKHNFKSDVHTRQQAEARLLELGLTKSILWLTEDGIIVCSYLRRPVQEETYRETISGKKIGYKRGLQPIHEGFRNLIDYYREMGKRSKNAIEDLLSFDPPDDVHFNPEVVQPVSPEDRRAMYYQVIVDRKEFIKDPMKKWYPTSFPAFVIKGFETEKIGPENRMEYTRAVPYDQEVYSNFQLVIALERDVNRYYKIIPTESGYQIAQLNPNNPGIESASKFYASLEDFLRNQGLLPK